MTHFKEAAGRRQSGAGCPAWCVLDHDRDGQPTIVLHESLHAVIELSGLPEADVRERVDVRTTQYSPEESGELPRTPWVELAWYQDCRYRVSTLSADEARQLAAALLNAAAHADGDPLAAHYLFLNV